MIFTGDCTIILEMIREGTAVPNIIDQMEVHIFAAQLARLSRLTGKTANADFIREMYERVKDRYVEELQNRKIRLRTLDGARLDEIVSYITPRTCPKN